MSATWKDLERIDDEYREKFGCSISLISGMDPSDYGYIITLARQAIDRGSEIDENDLFEGDFPDDVDL